MREAYPTAGCDGRRRAHCADLASQLLSAGAAGGRRDRLDRPAKRIYNLVRAVTHPYPGAFTWRRDAAVRLVGTRQRDRRRRSRWESGSDALGRSVRRRWAAGRSAWSACSGEGSPECTAAEWATRGG